MASDYELGAYLIFNYPLLMTLEEYEAHRYLQLSRQVERQYSWGFVEGDPGTVMPLAADGWRAFAERTGARILRDHPCEVVINHCPQCHRLAHTSSTRSCRYCDRSLRTELEKEFDAIACYVMQYHANLMNDLERRAELHLQSLAKSHSALASYNPAEQVAVLRRRYEKVLSRDPAVLELIDGGYVAFAVRTARRILADNPGKVELNLCPRCLQVARTAKAKQCRYCGHSWRESQPAG